ncbi:hypothetical protein ACLOJK_007006 [Asimina triloba]
MSPHRRVYNMVSLLREEEDTVPRPSNFRKAKKIPLFRLVLFPLLCLCRLIYPWDMFTADRLAAGSVPSHTARKRSSMPGKESKENRK